MDCARKYNDTLAAATIAAQDPFPLRRQLKHLHTTVTITVGSAKTPFLLHKELLTLHSRFFAAALDGAFAEGVSQTVNLPDERVEIFEYFAAWLYHGFLIREAFLQPSPSPSSSVPNPNSHSHSNSNLKTETPPPQKRKPTFFLLLPLHTLADRLSVEKLRNETLDVIAALAEETNAVPTPADTWTLYETTPASSRLRKLVLDLFAYKKTDHLLASHPDEWNPLFLRDLTVKLKRRERAGLGRHELVRQGVGSGRANGELGRTNEVETRACEVCRIVVRTGAGESRCRDCGRAFCRVCVGRGVALPETESEERCRPWAGKGRGRYHEHVETAAEGCCGWVEE